MTLSPAWGWWSPYPHFATIKTSTGNQRSALPLQSTRLPCQHQQRLPCQHQHLCQLLPSRSSQLLRLSLSPRLKPLNLLLLPLVSGHKYDNSQASPSPQVVLVQQEPYSTKGRVSIR